MSDLIFEVLATIYGNNETVRALSANLAEKISEFEERDPYLFGDNQFHNMIMNTCWNWYGGGGTAEIAATKIEAALDVA